MNIFKPSKIILLLFCLLNVSEKLSAQELWLMPGDLQLRSEIQILKAANIISQPINAWPLPLHITATLDEHCQKEATSMPASGPSSPKLCARIRAASQTDNRWQLELKAGTDNPLLTDFGYTPRAETELTLSNEFTGQFGEINISIAALEDPLDEHPARFDNSFAQLNIKGWRFGVGAVDRWWGPGWRAGMILSTNARPVPGLYMTRATEKAAGHWSLKWLGTWHFTQFFNQLESSRTIEKPLLWGMRFNFQPTQHLEIGLSRTAIWGGEGRPQSLDTFLDLLAGKDNFASNDPGKENEPGNQLGGFDFQYSRLVFDQMINFYGEVIGEDEAGGLPSRPIGLFGFHWAWLKADYKLNALLEYSDSSVDFLKEPRFNVAYNHSIYQTGYRYYQRALGDTADNDSRRHSLGVWINLSEVRQAGMWLSHFELNRDNAFSRNPVSINRTQLNMLEFWQSIRWKSIDWELRAGYFSRLPENLLGVENKSYFSLGMRYRLPN